MLTPLAYYYTPWRAHLVRALLAQNGIASHLCNENAMYLYAPGSVLSGALMVEEADLEEALAVLGVKPVPLEDGEAMSCESGPSEAEVGDSYQRFPGFLTVVVGFFVFYVALTAGFMAQHLWLSLAAKKTGGSHPWLFHLFVWTLEIAGMAIAGGALAAVLLTILRLAQRANRLAHWFLTGLSLIVVATLFFVG